MKRVAESQLTKDIGDDEEEQQDISSGFKMADPSVLETRKIRGLPKRSLAPTNPSPTSTSSSPAAHANGPETGTAEDSPKPTTRFGAFTGFGAPAISSFAFKPLLSPADNTVSQSSAPPPTFLTTSIASKALPVISNSSNPTPPNTSPLNSDVQSKQDAALKYYKSLRGLNSSFLDAATKVIQTDPFADIAKLLEEYKSFRIATQREFDEQSMIRRTEQAVNSAAPTVTPHNPSSKAPFPTPTSQNTFTFGTNPGVPVPHVLSIGGFTPKVDSSNVGTSPFSWPSKSSSNPFGISEKLPALGSQPETVGSTATHILDSPSTYVGSKQVSEPTSHNRFSSSDPTQSVNKSSDSKQAVIPDSNSSTEKSSFGANSSFFFSKPANPTAPLTPGLSSFLGPSKPPTPTRDDSSLPPSTGAPPPSPPTFGFGSGKTSGTLTTFGSFAKGSIGNPVGFGFGVTSSVSGIPALSGNSVASPGDTASDDGLSSNQPDTSQGSIYDRDGLGEEDETTLYETRAKAYKMVPTGEQKSWTLVGTGQMKLKAHKESKKRRILMRNSSTGQIILNFGLLPTFKVTANGKEISFCVPGEDQSSTIYRLRVSTETDATKWKETVCQEVDHLTRSDHT